MKFSPPLRILAFVFLIFAKPIPYKRISSLTFYNQNGRCREHRVDPIDSHAAIRPGVFQTGAQDPQVVVLLYDVMLAVGGDDVTVFLPSDVRGGITGRSAQQRDLTTYLHGFVAGTSVDQRSCGWMDT